MLSISIKIGTRDRVARLSNQKNTNLGKFCGAFDWKMLIYFTAICNILRTFWIIYYHLVYFGVFFAVLVSFTKKNLATLPRDRLYPQFFDTNNGHL
jgi:hypothetical protein